MTIPGNLLTKTTAVLPHTSIDRALEAALSLDIPPLKSFLDRGGILVWGIVPTGFETFAKENLDLLAFRLETIWKALDKKGIPMDQILEQGLISPATCCLVNEDGDKTVEKAFEVTRELSGNLKKNTNQREGTTMKIHYLQHVPFEDLGMMESLFLEGGHQLTSTKFFKPHMMPSVHDFDCLIVMGGPMGVNDDSVYPWLRDEKNLIEEAVKNKKTILGICLGAQLIAQVLGARVFPNKYREIGWFDIEITQAVNDTILADVFPQETSVFHWHGDTFDIPEGAVHIAKSEACLNQGFVFENHIVGFQFHLESTLQTIKNLILNCSDEIDGSKYVQSETTILSRTDNFTNINNLMGRVLKMLLKENTKQECSKKIERKKP